MTLTSEQQTIITTLESSPIVCVSAKAGTGKTSTSLAIVAHFHPKKGLYTAFNKSIVLEATEKFPKSVQCKTIHAFALAYVQPKKKIEPVTYSCFTEKLSYPDMRVIIDTMDTFFLSSSTCMESFMECIEPRLATIAIRYIHKMIDEEIPPTFNFLLKYLHLQLDQGLITIDLDLAILDECLPGYMFVDTSTGPRVISSVCKDLEQGKEVLVKSFDHETHSFEYKKAKNPIVSHNRELLRVTTEGLNKLDCTPNHPILTQRGYIKAEDLEIGTDMLILDTPSKQKTKAVLNYDQFQVILGSYLGDGNLRRQSDFHTYRLRLTHGVAQLDYLKWKASALLLEDTIHLGTSGYTGRKDIYHTNYTPTFVLGGDPFEGVINKLDVLGLAIWVMDDGSESNGCITIHSNSFTEKQNERLATMLYDRFGLRASVYKTREYFMLSFSRIQSVNLVEIIKPYIHKDLGYKFGGYSDVPTLNAWYENYGANFISSIEKLPATTVYDFEVEDNHNFVTKKSKSATGIVVHNCQDTTEVAFEIFMLLNAEKKLIVGDPHQNIYEYLNTVNAFNLIHDVPILPLTTTFRCSPLIASRVQSFGETHLDSDFHYIGVGTDVLDPSIAYISRTNGSVLMRIDTLLDEGQSFTLTKPIKELLALPMALANVSSGRPVFHKQYMYLEKEYKKYALSGKKGFFQYLRDHVDDEELHGALSFMQQLSSKNINIFQLKKDVEAMKPDPNIWVVTSHSFKGREVNTVFIEEDLNRSVLKAIEEYDRQELNLGYVAATRAKTTIINCKYL